MSAADALVCATSLWLDRKNEDSPQLRGGCAYSVRDGSGDQLCENVYVWARVHVSSLEVAATSLFFGGWFWSLAMTDEKEASLAARDKLRVVGIDRAPLADPASTRARPCLSLAHSYFCSAYAHAYRCDANRGSRLPILPCVLCLL
jgi:hypothetical protein